MPFETLLYEVRGEVVLVHLNRPDRLNVYTTQMRKDLTAAIGQVNADPALGAMVLTGAGRAANPDRQLRMIKELLTKNGADSDLDAVMEREYAYLFESYDSPEHKEAVNAFVEKRAPVFKRD